MLQFTATDFKTQWGNLVAETWTDEELRERLMADPREVLEEHGVPVPVGLEVRVLQNTDSVVHLPIPARPSMAESTEDGLPWSMRHVH